MTFSTLTLVAALVAIGSCIEIAHPQNIFLVEVEGDDPSWRKIADGDFGKSPAEPEPAIWGRTVPEGFLVEKNPSDDDFGRIPVVHPEPAIWGRTVPEGFLVEKISGDDDFGKSPVDPEPPIWGREVPEGFLVEKTPSDDGFGKAADDVAPDA